MAMPSENLHSAAEPNRRLNYISDNFAVIPSIRLAFLGGLQYWLKKRDAFFVHEGIVSKMSLLGVSGKLRNAKI
jgi:hypothetical protein